MDNRRLIFTLIFAFSVFMLWDAWQRFTHPELASKPVAKQAADTPQPSTALRVGGVDVPTVEAVSDKVEIVTLETDLFIAKVSSRGGDLISVVFKDYASETDKNKRLELLGESHRYAVQSGLIGQDLANHKTLFKVVNGQRQLGDKEQAFALRLEAPVQGGIKATKVYTFTRGSYVIHVSWEVENVGSQAQAPNAYFQIQRDTRTPEGESSMIHTFTGPAVFTDAEKYQKVSFDEISENKAKFAKTADNGWLAMIQHHFVTAWAPQGNTEREFYMRKLDKDMVTAGLILPMKSLATGEKARLEVPLYVGPQIQKSLKELAPSLELVVDYGWLTIIAAPIFWLLQAIHAVVNNWGWAIVVLTIGIKLAFFPLSAASYKSMAKMRTVTPRLVQLKERFADDKPRLQQEMMKLYQTEKINPLGGCLPILIQIPVFIALYWVLLGAVEMRDAPWALWISDLGAPDPYFILPVIMMATMFLQTKLNPTPPDPLQAKIMMMMPLVFGVMFFFFPAGLVLYWVVNNILSIAQQWQINRMIEGGGKSGGHPPAANDAAA